MTPFAKVRLAFIISILALFVADQWVGISNLYYAVPVIVFVLFLLLATTTLSMEAFAPAYTQPTLVEKKIAVTFDDGPSPQTLEILNVLKKYQAKATFFCIGFKIEKYPEVIKKVSNEGHTIGNHSYSHNNLFPFFRKAKIKKEITETNSLIVRTIKKENSLFRPPFGVINPTIGRAVKETGQYIIGWNIRSFDTSNNKRRVIDRVLKQLKPGAVILLHDDRESTPEILEAILQEANRRQLQCVDVNEIFNLKKHEA